MPLTAARVHGNMLQNLLGKCASKSPGNVELLTVCIGAYDDFRAGFISEYTMGRKSCIDLA